MLFNALAALGHRGIKTTATFGRAGLMPVSYTHLDVYKRQSCSVWVVSP